MADPHATAEALERDFVTRLYHMTVVEALVAEREHLAAELTSVRADLEEWKQEAERRGWPKEAAQEYHRLKVDYPAAIADLEAAREALRDARAFLRNMHAERAGDVACISLWEYVEMRNTLDAALAASGQTEGQR